MQVLFYFFFLIFLDTDPAHYLWIGGLDALNTNEWFWSKSMTPLKVLIIHLNIIHLKLSLNFFYVMNIL